MENTKLEYTHDDVMQALCCMMRFQDLGAAYCAADVLAKSEEGLVGDCGFVYQDGAVHLDLGPCNARVSNAAARLMAAAYAEADDRVRLLREGYGFSHYDLRPPGE